MNDATTRTSLLSSVPSHSSRNRATSVAVMVLVGSNGRAGRFRGMPVVSGVVVYVAVRDAV